MYISNNHKLCWLITTPKLYVEINCRHVIKYKFIQSWQKVGQISFKSTATCIMCSVLLQLLTPQLQFMRQVQVWSELLPMILFAAFSLARPFSPALGTISLPGRVAVKPTAIFAEQLSLCDTDPSLLLSPHPSQNRSFTWGWKDQHCTICIYMSEHWQRS